MAARQKLTETESTLAFVAGGGMTLTLLAFGLGAMRGNSANTEMLNIMMYGGLFLIVLGIALWVVFAQPWKNFDDWSKPLYTGHHDDHHAETHDEHHHEEDVAHAGVAPVHAHASHVIASEPARIYAPTDPHAQTGLSRDVIIDETVPYVTMHEIPSEYVIDEVTDVETDPAVYEETTTETVSPVAAINAEVAATAALAEDNLEIIEGIGPKIAGALRAAGIRTFTQLTTYSADELEKIVRDAKVRMVGHADTWVKQAQLAAEGKTEALAQLQEEIRHNRTPGND